MKSKIQSALTVYREKGAKGVAQAILMKLANLLTERNAVAKCDGIPSIWPGYCSWLTMANAGMLSRDNVSCFDYAIKNLSSDAPIVEIGSFCGLSTNMITYFKEKYVKKNLLITCDNWIFEGSEQGGGVGDSRTVLHSEYREFVKETFIRNIKMFSRYDLPYTIEVISDELFDAWRQSKKCRDILNREVKLGGPISFCYIDGNHLYDYAKRDFENCDKFLEVGGFVLFDDSAADAPCGVYKVVEEVMHSGRYELIANNPNYFFKKIKPDEK